MEQITMPQLGESVTEGTIERWLVQPGERIEKYDPIAEVQTDKVFAEIPSSFSGTMGAHLVQVGEVVPVGEAICTIDLGEASMHNLGEQVAHAQVVHAVQPPHTTPKAARYSPVVRRLATEHHIDLTAVTGSGAGGRITRNDIEAMIAADGQTAIKHSPPCTTQQIEHAPKEQRIAKPLQQNGDTVIPVSRVRRAIAENMTRSLHEIPHAWMAIEVDVTDIVNYRTAVKDAFFDQEGFTLTYFPFFIEAVAKALKKFPLLNSTWEGDYIRQHKDVHISVAVATDEALYVPVIRHADDYSVRGLAKQLNRLATSVREGTVTTDQMQGGTFTVNNTGTFGSVLSRGIINYPQAAIIQIELITQKPVFIAENVLSSRQIVNLCMSFDHRILDGLICGKFLQYVKDLLENFENRQMSVD